MLGVRNTPQVTTFLFNNAVLEMEVNTELLLADHKAETSQRDNWSSAIFLSPPFVALQAVNTVDNAYNSRWMLWYLKRIRMVAAIYVGVSGDN